MAAAAPPPAPVPPVAPAPVSAAAVATSVQPAAVQPASTPSALWLIGSRLREYATNTFEQVRTTGTQLCKQQHG
jgi:hypothetical protein